MLDNYQMHYLDKRMATGSFRDHRSELRRNNRLLVWGRKYQCKCHCNQDFLTM